MFSILALGKYIKSNSTNNKYKMCLTTIEMLNNLSKILRNMLTTNNNILLVLLNLDNSKTFPKLSVMYNVNLIFCKI